jgi:Uma2 family endonuclease
MAVAAAPRLLTYEEYLAEGEVMLRYDIVDGVRYVTNPTTLHNDIIGALYLAFHSFSLRTKAHRVLLSPRDILIREQPLRTRQPDILLMSRERWALCPPRTNPAPLRIAPELVVEVLSPSDTPSVLAAKLEDFRTIGINECWVVTPEPRTVEVLRLGNEGIETVALYGEHEEVVSEIFPDLRVSVAALFAVA